MAATTKKRRVTKKPAKKTAKAPTRGKTTRKKGAATSTGSKKNSLVANINRKKRSGASRPKSRSTVSKKAYEQMQEGWPNSAKKRARP